MEALPHFNPEYRKADLGNVGKARFLVQEEYKKQLDQFTSIEGIGITLAAAIIVDTG